MLSLWGISPPRGWALQDQGRSQKQVSWKTGKSTGEADLKAQPNKPERVQLGHSLEPLGGLWAWEEVEEEIWMTIQVWEASETPTKAEFCMSSNWECSWAKQWAGLDLRRREIPVVVQPPGSLLLCVSRITTFCVVL